MTDFNWNGDALLSSAVGAFIGSVLTLLGVWMSSHLEKFEREAQNKEELIGFLQGIHDEIETLWDSYTSSIGAQTEALLDNSPLMFFWPITQEYFTIYNTNAHAIGKIKNHDLRRQIVATYAKARGLIDSYRMNNDLIQKYEYIALLFQETNSPSHQANAAARYQSLIQYAAQLRPRHNDLKTMVGDLLRNLRKEGVLAPNGSKS